MTEPSVAPNECDIWLIRHGESESNAGIGDKTQIRIAGRTVDSPLSAAGIVQAQKVGDTLRTHLDQVSSFYSSAVIRENRLEAMKRTKKTAEIIQKAFNHNHPISFQEGLIETHYGDLEASTGESYDPAESKMKSTLPALASFEERMEYRMSSTDKANKGMESNKQVFERMTATIEQLAQNNLGKSIVCVTHNGGIKSLFMHFLAKEGKEVMYHRFSVGNCAILRLKWDGSNLSMSNIANISMR